MKLLSYLAALAIIAFGILWISEGSQIFTADKRMVESVITDPIFGTSHTEVTYADEFQYGLLPDSMNPLEVYRGYIFVLATGGAVILLSLFITRYRRRSNT